MIFQRGEIVWVRFPFTDVSATKVRPALILSNEIVNRTGDYLLMQITSKLRGDHLSLLIGQNHFKGNPLLMEGELRLHKIFILNQRLITGTITQVTEEFVKKVIVELTKLIQ